jgi:hypothetical protein
MTEHQLASDSKNLNRSEHQFREQLAERNTLLMTVYSYMDKLGAVESPTVKVVPLYTRQVLDYILSYLEEISQGRAKAVQQL